MVDIKSMKGISKLEIAPQRVYSALTNKIHMLFLYIRDLSDEEAKNVDYESYIKEKVEQNQEKDNIYIRLLTDRDSYKAQYCNLLQYETKVYAVYHKENGKDIYYNLQLEFNFMINKNGKRYRRFPELLRIKSQGGLVLLDTIDYRNFKMDIKDIDIVADLVPVSEEVQRLLMENISNIIKEQFEKHGNSTDACDYVSFEFEGRTYQSQCLDMFAYESVNIPYILISFDENGVIWHNIKMKTHKRGNNFDGWEYDVPKVSVMNVITVKKTEIPEHKKIRNRTIKFQ